MLALRALPGVDFWPMSQGLFGAASKKPMHKSSLPQPAQICQDLAKNMVTVTIPNGCSIGRTEQGQWATSALKEYPPAMSKALATRFFTEISQVPTAAQVDIDVEYLAMCKDDCHHIWTGHRPRLCCLDTAYPVIWNSSAEPRRKTQKASWKNKYTQMCVYIYIYIWCRSACGYPPPNGMVPQMMPQPLRFACNLQHL